ncbi:MAG: hypothetical protein COA79_17465 [Planctomycetota bacterium]|nr:MAG: hypothetical protein COA79_17465 [Planctomycetota bacterium]
MKQYNFFATLIILLVTGVNPWGARAADITTLAKNFIETSKRKTGLCVHLGVTDGKLTAALGSTAGFLVHGLAFDQVSLTKAQAHIQSVNPSGEVTVELLRGKSLPYADHLVNLLVIDDLAGLSAKGIDLKEVTRVLSPGGLLCLNGKYDAKLKAANFTNLKKTGSWTLVVKPRPEEMDEWTHFDHGGSGNRVSQDKTFGTLGGIRWFAGPLWPKRDQGGSAKAIVSSGGRNFYLTQCALPNLDLTAKQAHWYLVARDSFNGLLQWQRLYEPYTRLPRDAGKLVVAVKDKLYVGFSIKGGNRIEVLEAATGKKLKSHKLPGPPRKLVFDAGVLILQFGGKYIISIDPINGKTHWRGAGADELTIGNGRIMCLARTQLTCLDAVTGKEKWNTPYTSLKDSIIARKSWKLHFVHKGIVMISQKKPNRIFYAISATDGKLLWKFKIPTMKYNSRHGLEAFFIDDVIWAFLGGDKKGQKGHPTLFALDPDNGGIKRTVQTKGFLSPGCGQLSATSKFVMSNRPVASMFDLGSGKTQPFKAVRGPCQIPLMPANGLIYSVPQTCVCKGVANNSLRGFMAMTSSATTRPKGNEERLEKGTFVVKSIKKNIGDWPTLRGDAKRSGYSSTIIPSKLNLLWEKQLSTRLNQRALTGDWNVNTLLGDPLSGATIVGGTVFIALPNEHRVVALKTNDGSEIWSFTAGGMVDSPPTIESGRCIFGSRDGWVYCLNAVNGALAWRFRVSPRDFRIMAFGQLESPWPLSGSVLVQGETVTVVAGRTTESDGGIFICALDAGSGKLLWEKNLMPESIKGEFEGVAHSIMVGDGQAAYMSWRGFDLKTGGRVKGSTQRTHKGILVAGTRGILDGQWRRLPASSRGYLHKWKYNDNHAMYMHLAFDDKQVYGYLPKISDKENSWVKVISSKIEARLANNKVKNSPPVWFIDVPAPAQVESMLVTGNVLVAAGTNDFVNHKGGFLWILSAKNGQKLSQIPLDFPPVWEGLAAAGGYLYVSTIDGKLHCFGKN